MSFIRDTINIELNPMHIQAKLSSFLGVPSEADSDSFIDKSLEIKPNFVHDRNFIPLSVMRATKSKNYDDVKSPNKKHFNPTAETKKKKFIKKNIMQPDAYPLLPKIYPSVVNTVKVVPSIESFKVFISYIESPLKFYVQTETFCAMSKRFINTCSEAALYATKPDNVTVGKMYLIHIPAEGIWHRGNISKILSDEMNEVVYIDFGTQEKVQTHR